MSSILKFYADCFKALLDASLLLPGSLLLAQVNAEKTRDAHEWVCDAVGVTEERRKRYRDAPTPETSTARTSLNPDLHWTRSDPGNDEVLVVMTGMVFTLGDLALNMLFVGSQLFLGERADEKRFAKEDHAVQIDGNVEVVT